VRLNCESRAIWHQNLLWQKPCEAAKTDSRAKFGKETVAGAHGRPKWVLYYGAQADLGHTQALLRLCSGSAPACSPSAQVCSPSAQVKAAVAHVRRLKRNQRKGKLILSLWVSGTIKWRYIKTLYSNQALKYMPPTSRCSHSHPSHFCCHRDFLIAWFFLTRFILTYLLNSCPLLCSLSELCLGSEGAEAPYIFKCSGEGVLPLLLPLLLPALMCRIN
jgi:hypothetical protein